MSYRGSVGKSMPVRSCIRRICTIMQRHGGLISVKQIGSLHHLPACQHVVVRMAFHMLKRLGAE